MIKVGDRLPEGTVKEYIEVETPGCPVGPKEWKVEDLAKGKKIVLFGLPGAFTPTCSAKHVPGYLASFDALKGKGVDEIWCVSVNDPWVMGAWGRDQKAVGKIRFFADGAGDYTRKLGMEREIPGMGLRSQRYSLLVEDGLVKSVNLEAPGKFEVSDAQTMLKALG
jgi:peroxiredoxin